LYRRILKECIPQLQQYYPGQELTDEGEEAKKLTENTWTVINCNVGELEDRLRSLPPGRKQVTVARFEDKITAVINELDVVL